MKLDEPYIPENVETRWYDFWQKEGLFAAQPSEKEPYTIMIPPPNVTGRLHMGHALFVTLQDVLIRWKRMSGYEVLWQPGTDHAGIATQVMVERALAEQGSSRHELGREKFLQRAWEWTEENGGTIIEQMKRMGASADWSRERFTMDEQLSRAVREAFVRLYEEKLIYRDERMVDWDPVTQTVLSDLEVDREEEEGTFWYLRYPLADGSGHIVVGTTRPETMLGDTAVAVHPDDDRYKSLIGKKILLPIVGREILIIADEVLPDPEKGTGAVKVTPSHDPNDFECGIRHGLERIQVIGFDGAINENGPKEYQGLDRYQARQKVIHDFKELGLFEKEERRAYAPGRSQRSGAVVEPLPMLQWFINTDPLAKNAIQAVESGETELIPANWKKTFDYFMYNIRPWCISRQLWWGHRIPAWYCDECSYITVSREDVSKCGECGSTHVHQEEDVLDTWFSSALWPFSTLGWPEKTPELEYFYPTSVLETGFDILFFWVARMLMMGCWFMEKAPFKKVFLHAMVRDSKGQKMSKTKGNVIDPMHMVKGAAVEDLDKRLHAELLSQYPEGVEPQGADALRFTLGVYAAQGRDIKLEVQRMSGYRAFLNKLWNASKFVLMNLEGYEPRSRWGEFDRETLDHLTLADKRALTKCAEVVASVGKSLENFEFNEYANTLYHYVWHEFCDWHIESVKPTLFDQSPENAPARNAVREVLLYVLDVILRLMHPLTPFITEDIWQSLPRRPGQPKSIMIARFPEVKDFQGLEFGEAVEAMELVTSVIGQIRNIRGETHVKPSTPIPVLYVSGPRKKEEMLQEGGLYLKRLAKIDAFEFVSAQKIQEMKGCASSVVDGCQLRFPLRGLINFDEEIARLTKQIEKLDKEIARLDQKLSNERFVANAPAEIVEGDRKQRENCAVSKATLEQNLTELQAMQLD